jgi:hypothetical protein
MQQMPQIFLNEISFWFQTLAIELFECGLRTDEGTKRLINLRGFNSAYQAELQWMN